MSEDNVMRYYLEGRGPLWRLFWLWGVVGSWVLFAVFYTGLQQLGVTWTLFVVSAVIMVPYTGWVLTSVWMCAANVANRMWGDAARFLTIIWALNVGFVGGWILYQLAIP